MADDEAADFFAHLKDDEEDEVQTTTNVQGLKLEDAEDEEEESEGEEESEEEEEEEDTRPKIAPVFKRKEERDTLKKIQELEESEEALEAERQKRLEERKLETKELLKQEILREMEAANKPPETGFEEEEDEEEDENEAEEYERWKIRELGRIKKEREEREKAEKEKEEVERRRGLTDAEVMQLDKERLKPKEKKKWNFLQKYYHKGAFFRTFDENDEFLKEDKWDFNQATLEDKFDKTILPKVMQVKNFGRAGRTKYTHLVDQDTTKWDSPWASKETAALRQKFQQKRMGGIGEVGNSKKKRKTSND